MSILGLLNQTITISSKATYGHDGRPTFSSAVAYAARVEVVKKRHLMPDGTVYTLDAKMIVGPSVTIVADDKVTYESLDYKVVDVFAVPGQNGATNHKEVKMILWPST